MITKGEWTVTDGIIWSKQGEPGKQTHLKPLIANVFETTPENKANAQLIVAAPELYETLKEISEGKGRFSRDPLTHAENTIEDMKELAIKAIAKVENTS